MDYQHITNFFDKFKKILSQGELANAAVVEILSRHLSSPIEVKAIQIKGAVIYVKASPLLRNEILIKKEAILKELAAAIPDRRFSDIR